MDDKRFMSVLFDYNTKATVLTAIISLSICDVQPSFFISEPFTAKELLDRRFRV